MSDILYEQIDRLQKKYLILLKSAYMNINKETFNAVVDEILVFWEKNMKIAMNIATHYFLPMKTFIFTGAAYMGIDDFEHYPFLAIGDKHIMDDPLCRYFDTANKSKNVVVSDFFIEYAILALKDNIKIIEQCYPHIIILPLRYLFKTNEKIIEKWSNDVFFSMFNEDIMSFDDYKKLNTIGDIYKSLLPNVASDLIFDSCEDKTVDFEVRFNSFVANSNYSKIFGIKDNDIFFLTIFGYISQALTIISMSLIFNCIPYIRNEVALNYMIKVSSNFDEDSEIQNVVFRSIVVHVLYDMFEIDIFDKIEFNDYIELLKSHNSSNKIFEMLDKNNINAQNIDVDSIISVTKKYIDELKKDIIYK